MESILNLIQGLSVKQREQIKNSPSMKDAFASDLSEDSGVAKEDIIIALDDIFGIEEIPIESKVVKIIKPKVAWDLGEDSKTKARKAKLLSSICDLLQENDGLSKTKILKLINKDNIIWRRLADTVLEYMLYKEMIYKVGSKYYDNIHSKPHENEFHRKVYSILCDGKKTTSAILNELNYRNPKGKRKLLDVLNSMIQHNIVVKSGNKWELVF
jgi:hypothetical protein